MLSVDPAINGLQLAALVARERRYTMDEKSINQVVKVNPFKIEKKAFRTDAMFLGDQRSADAKSFSINILYENTFDPADNVHRFTLQPDNPTFIKIVDTMKDAGLSIDEISTDIEQLLPPSLKDMYGAWVIVDMSKTPVCRVYTENVSRIVNGEVKLIHKAGTPIHKTDAKGNDTEELAILTQIPVWGFCRPNPDGQMVWMKGNDPLLKIQREINQGRMMYVNQDKDFVLDNTEQPAEKPAEENKTYGAAPGLNDVGGVD